MKIRIVLILVCVLVSCKTERPNNTKAHRQSAFSVIDPTYSSDRPVPEPDRKEGAPWLYGPVELESWKLQQMRISSKKAAINGFYPGVYHEPITKVLFRCILFTDTEVPSQLEFQTNGEVKVFYQGKEIYSHLSISELHQVNLPGGSAGKKELLIQVTTEAEPPAILIEKGLFATSNDRWEWKGGITGWQAAAPFPQTRSGVLPHQMKIPEMNLKPEKREGVLYDFGRELIGYVTFRCEGKPSMIVGESATEARDTVVSHHEQTLTMVKTGADTWVSEHPLAFRYLQILSKNPSEVQCRAQFWPVQYKGAFACSDKKLTQIWMTSAYTHRINKYEFLLDGIKRDRLPWIDNMKISSAVEAYTFADPEILRRTISVLGRESDKSSINNIVDYDALWLISQDAYQVYFDDPGFLRQEWPRIYNMIERMAKKCDPNGLLRWPQGSWTFIDWVSGWDKNMAEQVMWYWAQEAGIRLAERMGDEGTIKTWTLRVDALEKYLRKKAWDSELKAWTDPDKKINPTRHANLLSMVSGLSKPDQFDGIMKVLEGSIAEPVNSPSMIFYEIQTLAEMGKQGEALAKLKEIWGTMLDFGSTSFWEGFDAREKGDEAYRFYDRPLGKSMCHAWSAGPVALLPEIIFGLKPLSDGWKTFSVNPRPGLLEWASVTVPTKYGNILLELKGTGLILTVPAGTTAIWGERRISGPAVVTEKIT
ncbi:MAG: alpha-L-rhamnosidase C-terminal domain-containing protein [Bacteroidales bacterium]